MPTLRSRRGTVRQTTSSASSVSIDTDSRDAQGATPSQNANGGKVAEARCQPVVHDDQVSPAHGDRRVAISVAAHLAAQLPRLPGKRRLEHCLGDAEHAGRSHIEHGRPVLGDGADAELGVARSSQLAHGQDVERSAKRTGDLDGDRDATARQRDHNRPLIRQHHELHSQSTTGVPTIGEQYAHALIIVM
jgi:hypothetical protein